MPLALQYAPRFETATLIQRGLTTLLSCPVDRDGELAVPSAGTVAIYDGGGAVLINAAAVTVTDGVATYSLAGSATEDLDLERGWRLEWALTMDDGIVHTFVAEGGLVRCVPFPVLSDRVIWGRVPALNPRGPGQSLVRGVTTYQTYIESAWVKLVNDLDADENRVELVLSPHRLREPHLLLTLSLVFADLAARNPAHQASADKYGEAYVSALARAVLLTDEDGDGMADTVKPARPPLFLM